MFHWQWESDLRLARQSLAKKMDFLVGSKSWQNLCPVQSCFIGLLSTTRKQCDHQKPPKHDRLAVGAAVYSAH